MNVKTEKEQLARLKNLRKEHEKIKKSINLIEQRQKEIFN